MIILTKLWLQNCSIEAYRRRPFTLTPVGPYKYRVLMIMDISPGYVASHPLPVRLDAPRRQRFAFGLFQICSPRDTIAIQPPPCRVSRERSIPKQVSPAGRTIQKRPCKNRALARCVKKIAMESYPLRDADAFSHQSGSDDALWTCLVRNTREYQRESKKITTTPLTAHPASNHGLHHRTPRCSTVRCRRSRRRAPRRSISHRCNRHRWSDGPSSLCPTTAPVRW
jgi:hypothetical protein